MSLGGGNFSDQATCDANSAAYVSAFSTLNGQGVTVFAATGNDAQITQVSSPGCATGAVGVGSVGDAAFTLNFSNCTDNGAPDKVSCFSNATPVQGPGELLDIMAPGCNITSTWLDGGTNTICGTSMATPYAAGSAALLVEYLADNAISMTPAQIEQHMEATGVQVSDYRMAPGAPTFPRVSPPAMIGALAVDVPIAFSMTSVTSGSVTTGWSASAGAVEYRVYSSTDGGPVSLAGSVAAPATVFVDNSPDCGSLTYFVRAFDGTFESLPSNTDTDTARACPIAPSGLQLTPIDGSSHSLAWTDSNADETANVLQRQVNGGAFTDYQTLPAGTAIGYTDNLLGCGLYGYRAVSVRNGDRSAPSNVVQRAICAPANDNVANAEVVVADTAYTDVEANQSYATEEALDPIYSCRFGGAGAGFQGVWYNITPAADTRVTVSTAATTLAPPSAQPDTLVAIYTGAPGSLTQVACNDDISGSNFRSTVSSNLAAGTTNRVFVSQWVKVPAGTVGNLSTAFTWSASLVVPANDLVANATPFTSSAFTGTVTNAQNATTSATDLAHACATDGARVGSHTLWWTYTPGVSGTLDLDTVASSGSFTDTIMTVYTGTPGSFTAVACNDDVSGSNLRSQILDLAVTGGTKYTIYISRWSASPTTTAGTVVLNSNFTGTARGLLRVTTSPAVVSRVSVDGVVRSDWGLNWLTVPVGSHEVCFSDVPGFATPSCQTVAVAEGATTGVEGQFGQLGLLKVDVAPAGLPTTIFVDGEWRNEYGYYSFLEPGDHQVCWGDVPGFQAPNCRTVTVTAGGQTTVVGTFVASGSPTPGPAPVMGTYGFLRVTTSPAVTSRIMVDGVPRADWGLTWVKAPIGNHEVCFTDVPGFATPACSTVTITAGATTTVQGVFSQLGLLKVDVAPAGLGVDVVVNGVPRNQFGSYFFLEPGNYTVCGTSLTNWTTPTCQPVTVTAGNQTNTTLTYTPL